MGLAEKVGFGKWRLDDRLEPTLRRMGDRGDILEAYHRAMNTAKLERSLNHELDKGILDDVNDRSFLVIDTLHGEALFVETGKAANISEIERGMIVTVGPQSFEPKPSDYTIADIASRALTTVLFSLCLPALIVTLTFDPSFDPSFQGHRMRTQIDTRIQVYF